MWYSVSLAAISVLAGASLLEGHDGVDAYLDPGTGSIIIQVAIGVAVGGLAAVGIFWSRVRTFVRRIVSRGDRT